MRRRQDNHKSKYLVLSWAVQSLLIFKSKSCYQLGPGQISFQEISHQFWNIIFLPNLVNKHIVFFCFRDFTITCDFYILLSYICSFSCTYLNWMILSQAAQSELHFSLQETAETHETSFCPQTSSSHSISLSPLQKITLWRFSPVHGHVWFLFLFSLSSPVPGCYSLVRSTSET